MNKKAIIFFTAVFLLLAILFRAYLFNLLITYKTLEIRPEIAEGNQLKTRLDQLNPQGDFQALVLQSLKISDELEYVFKIANSNPNNMLTDKKANCVGYAACFATAMRYYLNKNEQQQQWQVQHARGLVYIMGIEIGKYLPAFFKSHDYVVLRNTATAEAFIIDPVMHDYLGIKKIRVKK